MYNSYEIQTKGIRVETKNNRICQTLNLTLQRIDMKPTCEIKFKTVIDKNTFYFFNPLFEEKYEGYINSLKDILIALKLKD